MTRAERKKLAKAARELASDFAEGRGPEVTNATSWCNCLAGVLVKRARVAESVLPSWVDNMVDGALSNATSFAEAIPHWTKEEVLHEPSAPVFPLLWLADELEAGR